MITTNRGLYEIMKRAVLEAPDDLLLGDIWDRENFSLMVDFPFTDAQWTDFVDFCEYEYTTAFVEWFEAWKAAPSLFEVCQSKVPEDGIWLDRETDRRFLPITIANDS